VSRRRRRDKGPTAQQKNQARLQTGRPLRERERERERRPCREAKQARWERGSKGGGLPEGEHAPSSSHRYSSLTCPLRPLWSVAYYFPTVWAELCFCSQTSTFSDRFLVLLPDLGWIWQVYSLLGCFFELIRRWDLRVHFWSEVRWWLQCATYCPVAKPFVNWLFCCLVTSVSEQSLWIHKCQLCLVGLWSGERSWFGQWACNTAALLSTYSRHLHASWFVHGLFEENNSPHI
jgi:hypothetical protein